jgi:hypothetical protein
MASLFIIFLLAVLLLLYNLVPSLRLDLTAHLKPVGDAPTFVRTAQLGPCSAPQDCPGLPRGKPSTRLENTWKINSLTPRCGTCQRLAPV